MTQDPSTERLTPLTRNDPTTIGSYSIRGVLGSGGMGVVYFAEQQRPKRSVAIKVMRPSAMGGTAARRFELEAELLGRLQHPGIAQIFEASTEGERHEARTFLAMEYVDGTTLTDYVRERDLDEVERVRLVVQLADAVHHAHQRGVLHRDLKPGNVLVTPGGELKVIDFGVARLIDDGERTQATLDGDVIGTLAYMSPEQIRGEIGALDTRVDVYAMGVIAFELLAGRQPFDLANRPLTSAIEAVCNQDPPRLGHENPACRGDLESIVAKCLEKDPERRYPSASALAADLRRFLAGEPVQARAASGFYQLTKFARRNRALVIGSATTVVALVLGLAGTGWGWISAGRANRQLEDSNRQLTQLNEDLERVASFQSELLSGVDVVEMASSLRRSTLADAREAERESLERALATVNFVDVAQESLEANLFRPSLGSIDRTFPDQPLVRAQLLHAVAKTALSLDLFDLAQEAQEEALSIRRAELGDIAPETLTSILRASETRRELGDYDAAMTLAEECIAGREELFGEMHLDTLAAKSHLASAFQLQARLAESEALFREILEGTRELLGEDDTRTQRSAHNLATVLRGQGRFEEAESLARSVLEWREENLGADHPDTTAVMESLSNILDDRGELALAVDYARQVVERRRRDQGDDHSQTASSIGLLATLLQRVGERDEAGELFREALAIQREALGEGHPSTLLAIARVGDWEFDVGDFVTAERLYREAWEGLRHALGEDHRRTMRAAASLGMVLSQLRRYEEAEPLYRAALEEARRDLGDDHPATLTCLANLGVLLTDLGRLEEAAPLLNEALEGRSKWLGPAHASTLNSYYNLGHLMHMMGRLEDAEPLLRYAFEQYGEALGPDSDGVLFSQGKLAEIQRERGEFAEATELFGDLYARRYRLFGAEHSNTTAALADFAASVRLQDQWDRFEEGLLERLDGAEGDPELEAPARRLLAEYYWARHSAQPGEGYDALAESWR